MTQRPCRVGDTVQFGKSKMEVKLIRPWAVAFVEKSREVMEFTVTRCGQCGKAVPSECECFEYSDKTGVGVR